MAARTLLATVNARSAPPSSSQTSTTNLCIELDGGKLVISKRTLIASIAVCGLLTLLSLLAAALLLYREYSRRRLAKEARAWGRKSRYNHRVSLVRKEIDTQYSRQYSGCLQHAPENPEMGSESPVELMLPERLHEVPAVPAQSAGQQKRKNKAVSLFFDDGHMLWMPKR